MVGKVTKLDFKTDSKARGRYACMAIYVNLGRPLVSKIFINGSLQRIEYENLPEVCFKCGCYGHIKENCPSVTFFRDEREGRDVGTSIFNFCGGRRWGLWPLDADGAEEQTR
ncbi:hypothetical protein Golob_005827, partial [Gossypium lobatum]|nr:hypothetical protein [Gossypium lobatum]